MRHFMVALLTTTMGAAADLTAQWPADVTPDTRVQARLPETQYQIDGPRGQLIRGRIAALAPDTLYLAVTDSLGPLAIPRALVQRLQISKSALARCERAAAGSPLGSFLCTTRTGRVWYR